MIYIMGGKVHERPSQCTHILIDQSDFNYCRTQMAREVRNGSVVNFKYLFHTYFFFKRMDVNDEEYKIKAN